MEQVLKYPTKWKEFIILVTCPGKEVTTKKRNIMKTNASNKDWMQIIEKCSDQTLILKAYVSVPVEK